MSSTKATNILVVDDEEIMRNLFVLSLNRLGYEVTTAVNGLHALELLNETEFDLIILDVLMPKLDGFETCSHIRERSDVPIIMVTALNHTDDVVRGLEVGADNYISKPFSFREVEAKVNALLRRTREGALDEFEIIDAGDLHLDAARNIVSLAGQQINLTATEYVLFHHLMQNKDRPVSKGELLRTVWGQSENGSPNLVELGIRRLRKKIEANPSKPKRLLTVRGIGYKISSQHRAAVPEAQSTRSRSRTSRTKPHPANSC